MKFRNWIYGSVVFLIFSGLSVAATCVAAPTPTVPTAKLDLTLKVPLFSDLFQKTPVAMVYGDPILLGDITRKISTQGHRPKDLSPSRLSAQFKGDLDGLIAEKQSFNKIDKNHKNTSDHADVEVFATPELDKDLNFTLRVPLFSKYFASTPVAEVAGQPIALSEMVQNLVQIHKDMSDKEKAQDVSLVQTLDRIMSVKLAIKEAETMGLDKLPDSQKLFSNYKERTLFKLFLTRVIENIKPDDKKIDDLYKRISQEVKTETYSFKTSKDIQSAMKKYKNHGDFEKVMAAEVKAGKAQGGKDEGYVKLKDLRPMVAQEAFRMKVGETSKIFKESSDSFLIFKLEGRRFVKDPAALQKATEMVLQQERKAKIDRYMKTLNKKYVKIDKQGAARLDFVKASNAAPKDKNSVLLQKMIDDQHVYARIKGNVPAVVTVSDVAKKIKEAFFHGVDQQDVTPKKINAKETDLAYDLLSKIVAGLEAHRLGIDRTSQYKKSLEDYRKRLLFGAFIEKVIVPGVILNEDKVRKYYDQNKGQYLNPEMLRLRSLVFHSDKEARTAIKQIRDGNDFNWVASNVEGLVDGQDADVLPFDNAILSVDGFPAPLQKTIADARVGDVMYYHDPGKYYYLLYVDEIFPAKPRPYNEVRKLIAEKVYKQDLADALGAYVLQLKSAYDVKVFLER